MALYARVTRTQGDPGRVDEAIANFKESLLPAIEQAPGFVGARLLVDRETGAGSAITFWESAGAMNAAEQLAGRLRGQTVQATGGHIVDVDRSEVLIFDTPPDPIVPIYSRLVVMYAQPEKVDAVVDFIRSEGHPRIRGYEGFRSFVLSVNRVTGRCSLSIGFESAAARDATEEEGAASRAKAAEIGGAPEPIIARAETVVATRVRAESPA
jgi:heme-degrading monooxygenase HmoA